MDTRQTGGEDGRGALSLGAALAGVGAFVLALALAALTRPTPGLKGAFGVLLLLALLAEAVAVVAGLGARHTERGRRGLRVGGWALALVAFAVVKTYLDVLGR